MGKITSEVQEMYNIFLDIGEFKDPNTSFFGMTGDWPTDRILFSEQYKAYRGMNGIENIEVNED